MKFLLDQDVYALTERFLREAGIMEILSLFTEQEAV